MSVNIFRDNVGFGILGVICGLFAFIYGWVKVDEYGIRKTMLWWTALIVLSFVVQILSAVVLGGLTAATAAIPACDILISGA